MVRFAHASAGGGRDPLTVFGGKDVLVGHQLLDWAHDEIHVLRRGAFRLLPFFIIPVVCPERESERERDLIETMSESSWFCLETHRLQHHHQQHHQHHHTRVGFPSWCGSFGLVRMQQSHQKWTKQAYRVLLEEVVSARFQTNPGVVHPTSNRPNCKKNWTKPAAVVSCAVHYGMRKCL